MHVVKITIFMVGCDAHHYSAETAPTAKYGGRGPPPGRSGRGPPPSKAAPEAPVEETEPAEGQPI